MLPKIMSEIKNKLSLSGGTVTGDVTINASLIADNLKAKAELLNPSTSSTTSSDINDNQIATTGFVHSVVSNNKYVHPTSTANGNYGTSKDTILNYEDSFSVPYITVNELGHISNASSISFTLPPANEVVDENVKQTLSTASGAYPLLASDSTSATSKTASAIIADGITLNPATKSLIASLFVGNLQGNADTATKLKTARTISLTGAVSGNAIFDGSANINIATTLEQPNISVSTASPSGGNDGDIWFKII